MILLSKTKQELKELITYMGTYAHRGYPPIVNLTFDSSFELLFQSLDNLKKKIGEEKYGKLWDMGEQAKVHFLAGDKKLGVNLMQDMNEILLDKLPFAYPANLWRWN